MQKSHLTEFNIYSSTHKNSEQTEYRGNVPCHNKGHM